MNDTLVRMKDSYGMLFEIETKLRRMVITNLLKCYGQTWLMQRYETTLYLHDLISYFGKFPKELPHFNRVELQSLYKLNRIRNKIAHSHLIDDEEYEYLMKCYRLIMRQPITKRRKKIKENVI
jgi:uncharacterized protein YfkK (UPF0435 family)